MAEVVSTLLHTGLGEQRLNPNTTTTTTLDINLEHNQGRRFHSKSVPSMEDHGPSSSKHTSPRVVTKDNRPIASPRARIASASSRQGSAAGPQSTACPNSAKSNYSPYAKTSFEFRSLLASDRPDSARSSRPRSSARNTARNPEPNTDQSTSNTEAETQPQTSSQKRDAKFRSPERIASGLRKFASNDNVQKLTRSPSSETIRLFRKPHSSTVPANAPLKALPRTDSNDDPPKTQPIRSNSDITANRNRNEAAPWASNNKPVTPRLDIKSRSNSASARDRSRTSGHVGVNNTTTDDPSTYPFKKEEETAQNPTNSNTTNKQHATSGRMSKQHYARHLSSQNTARPDTPPQNTGRRLIPNANASTMDPSDQSIYHAASVLKPTETGPSFEDVGQVNTNTIPLGQTDKPARSCHNANDSKSIVYGEDNSHKSKIKATVPFKENEQVTPDIPLHTHNSVSYSGKVSNEQEKQAQQDITRYNNASFISSSDQKQPSQRPATPYKGRRRCVNKEPVALENRQPVTSAKRPAAQITENALPPSPEDFNDITSSGNSSREPEALINAQNNNRKEAYSRGITHKDDIDSKQVKARQGNTPSSSKGGATTVKAGGNGRKVSGGESNSISHARDARIKLSGSQQLAASQRSYGGGTPDQEKEDTLKRGTRSHLLTNTTDSTTTFGDKDTGVCLDNGDKYSPLERNKAKLLRARGKLNEGLRRSKEGTKTRDKAHVDSRDKSSGKEQRVQLQPRGLTDTDILPNKTPSLPLPGKTFRSISNENFKVNQKGADSPIAPVLDASKRSGYSSSRSVYLSSQSLENFGQFDKSDFKSALQRLKTGSQTVTSSRARSPVSDYSNTSHPLGDILEDESECESDLHSDLEDNSPPWRSQRGADSGHNSNRGYSGADSHKSGFKSDRGYSGENQSSPWHSAKQDRNNNKLPEQLQKLQLPNPQDKKQQKERKLNVSLTKPYFQPSRSSSSPFQSYSMPNMTQGAVAVPSYATPLTSQLSSSKLNFTSNQSLMQQQQPPKMEQKQINVSMKPFASQSMVTFRGGQQGAEPSSPPWSSTRQDYRPQSRHGRGRSPLNGAVDTNDAVPNNSPVSMQRSMPMTREQRGHMNNGAQSYMHDEDSSVIGSPSTRMPSNRSMDTQHKRSYTVGLKDESDPPHFKTQQQNTRERPSSSKGRSRGPSAPTADVSQPETNARTARPQSSKGRSRTPALPADDTPPPSNPSRPQSSKGRSRGEPIFTDQEPAPSSSRPKSSKGRSRYEQSNDLSIDLSAVTNDHADVNSRPPARPDSGWRKIYRKPDKDIDLLDDSGNDTDVDGEIEILDLDKLDDDDPRDSQDSWDNFEVGVTGDVQYEVTKNFNHLKDDSSSSSRSSRSSDAWDTHAHNYHSNAGYHGKQTKMATNTKRRSSHHRAAVDKYLDPSLQQPVDGSAPDTPRLTPMQDSIRKSHNSLLINGPMPQRHNKTRLEDDRAAAHRQANNHSSNFHGRSLYESSNPGSPVDKAYAQSKDQQQKQQTRHSLLSHTGVATEKQEKLISKYRNRATLNSDSSRSVNTTTKGGVLPPQESRLNSRNRLGTPMVSNHNHALPRKLEPLSSPSNHSDSECDIIKEESSPDSGINVRLQTRRQSGPAGILTKPQKARKHKSKTRQDVVGHSPILRELPSSPNPFKKSPLSESQFSFESRDTEKYSRSHRPLQPDIYSSHRANNDLEYRGDGHSQKRSVRQTRSFPLH